MPDKGDYTDIILDVLNMPKGQTDPAVPLWNYPGARVRVPPDSMVDAPFIDVVEPDIDEDNPYITYESTRPPVAANKDVEQNVKERYWQEMNQLPGDLGAMIEGMEQARRK